MKEKEKDERMRREEKNRRDREEKERQKQREKEEKYKLKEEKDRQRQKEKEERERQKKKEKEEFEREKQRLREERRRYNEIFANRGGYNRMNQKNNPNNWQQNKNYRPQGGFLQRFLYNSNKLYHRKRRHSHKRIQPKNRIPRLDPKRHLGKTTLKIIKPKRYDEDESETEPVDFDEKLMKFPKFRAKYGKTYILKPKTRYPNLTTYLMKYSNKNDLDFKKPKNTEGNRRNTKKTNLTITEVDEDDKFTRYRNFRKGGLSQVKPKARINLDKKMKEILGKNYKLLIDDPLNPYGTFWPSNFLKYGYDAGFEYEDFQSGVPLLKLRNIGKKQLPPIKKKGLNFNENTVYSNKKYGGSQSNYPGSSAKKNINEEIYDIKTNKSENFKFNNNTKLYNGNNEKN